MRELEKKDFLKLQSKPYYSSDLIVDGGFSTIWLKRMIFFILLPFPFAIFFNSNLKFTEDKFFIILAMFFFSFYYFQRFFIPAYNYFRAKFWFKTVANVVIQKIVKIEIKTKHSSYFNYYPMVYYKYEVDSKIYTNNRFSFQSEKVCNPAIDPYHKKPIDDFFEEIDREKKVEIFYNSYNPKESVIIRDFSTKDKIFYNIMAILTLVMLGLSSYYLFSYFK